MTFSSHPGAGGPGGKLLSTWAVSSIVFLSCATADLCASEAAKNSSRQGAAARHQDDIDILLNQAEQRGAMFQKLMQVIPPELVPEELKTLIPATRNSGAPSDPKDGMIQQGRVDGSLGAGVASHGFFDLIPVCGEPVKVYLVP